MQLEDGNDNGKPILDVEVCLKGNSNVSIQDTKEKVTQFLFDTNTIIEGPGKLSLDSSGNQFLEKSIEYIRLSSDYELTWPLYLYLERLIYPSSEELDSSGEFTICHITSLPNRLFENLWESLVYDGDIKNKLLNYISTALLFTDMEIDSSIITWNKVVLLYGPPGTGKTSLCKSLAQKLSIQFSDRYESFYFIEINSHSLFSKWFSESGKLVVKMFDKIREYIEIPGAFICILMDEVESLTRARNQMNGEPSDAIRAVNAVLTEIDNIKTESNVLIMATSNLTNTIDDAFMDRADIKQFIGNPGIESRKAILQTCIDELEKRGLLVEHPNLSSNYEELFEEAISKSDSLSGRALRKLPFLAYSMDIKKRKAMPYTKSEFMTALIRAMEIQREAS